MVTHGAPERAVSGVLGSRHLSRKSERQNHPTESLGLVMLYLGFKKLKGKREVRKQKRNTK